MPFEILVLGAGAVGAFYASRLAQVSDVNVSCICRSNYAAVARNGFSISSTQYGTYKFTPRRAFSSPAEAGQSHVQWDYVIVATKALPDVSDDSTLLDGLVSPATAILLVQNGLGIEKPYANRFPQNLVISGVTIASCVQPQPGAVKHNRWTRLTIGPYLPPSNSQGSPFTGPRPLQQVHETTAKHKTEQLVHWLQQGGIKDAEACEHAAMQLTRWHKIAINAAMNPTSVLSGGTTNVVMTHNPEIERHLRGIMNEVLDTAPKVLGVQWPSNGTFADAEQILRSLKKSPSGSRPSMMNDWAGGKKMELEVILGEPIKQAREVGVEMPRLQSCYAMLKMAQENRETHEGKSRL